MTIAKVWAVYFTGTGTTRKIVETVAAQAAAELGAPAASYDFSLPAARAAFPAFGADEFAVFGTPVYAGRVPNVLLKALSGLRGGGAAAAAVVVFGNRAYDDALIELRDILSAQGFHPCAAAAFVGEHSFSRALAAGRPDAADCALAKAFGAKAAAAVRAAPSAAALAPVAVRGEARPYRGYYQPRDRAGNPIDIRKVKPETSGACTSCGLCAAICPMGAVDAANPRNVPGVCIKCCACVKRCPAGAKSFTDPAFLYHQRELEETYRRPASPELFV